MIRTLPTSLTFYYHMKFLADGLHFHDIIHACLDLQLLPFAWSAPPPTNPSKYCCSNHIAFLVLYAFTFSFANRGPNAMIFIVPVWGFSQLLWDQLAVGFQQLQARQEQVLEPFGFFYAAQGWHKGPTKPWGIQGELEWKTSYSCCHSWGHHGHLASWPSLC